MIWLTDETRKLIEKMEKGIDKPGMQANWEDMMEFAPIHSGSPEEVQAIRFMQRKLEEYGLETRMHWFEAYLSDPQYSR